MISLGFIDRNEQVIHQVESDYEDAGLEIFNDP